MFISINWIKDFVDLDGVDIEKLINRFTMATAEVEGYEKRGYDTNGVVAGKIISVEKHPQSDKLKITKVDTGKEVIQSLCGAPNVNAGDIIPFAPAGATVCGVEVKSTEIAGEKTNGVCLSEKELGISDDHSGLMILPTNTKVGEDIKNIMPIEDVIFEVDNKSLTNRPDLWGHYGIAREIAALVGKPLKPLAVEDLEIYNNLPNLDVKVEDTDKCYRYSAIAIENITRRVSDITMRIRLYYCGARAINLLADITNYIMFELGQPMHAFDKALVSKINVKTLGKEQMFKTLDGEERMIYDDTLMICEGDEPVAIAGIKGGEKTEIRDNTNSLLLESANFDPLSTRKTATKLGLRTEASARYEKTLDPELTTLAIARYIKLLKDADENIKVVSSMTDVYAKKYPHITVDISKEYVSKKVGMDISADTIEKTLKSLEFGVERNGDNFKVSVPSFRGTKDISMKDDLVEEISRIYGYDNIIPKTTLGPIKIIRDSESRKNDYIIKDLLSQKYGCSEAYSYVWYDTKLNKELKIKTNDNIKIINSLDAQNSTLRESMIPSMIKALYQNVKTYSEISLFEIGEVFEYKRKNENCDEYKHLGVILGSKSVTEKELVYKIKGIVNSIFRLTKNVSPEIVENDGEFEYSWINPINAGVIKYNGNTIGYMSVLNLAIKESIDKKMNIVVLELRLDRLNEIEYVQNMYQEISKYQEVNFDLSLVVDKNTNYSELDKYIENAEIENLTEHTLVDVYEDENTLKDKKSVTIKFKLESLTHTLTNDEITTAENNLIKYFEERGIKLRG